MKRVRYTKFTGDLSSSFGLEDLMQALSDFLLDSGFQDPMSRFQEFDGDQTMPAGIPAGLRRKILVENPLATYDRLQSA